MIRLETPALLVSDVHLSAAFPERTKSFFTFLRGPARNAPTVCILGDLFDAWTGDDDASGFADSLREELRALSECARIFIARGNRDFLLGAKFAAEANCVVWEDDATAAEIGGRKFLLAHGDHLLDDPHYLRYRGRVRGRLFSFFANALPGGARMRIARVMRSFSRGGKDAGRTPTGEFRFNRQAAELEMRGAGCEILAHGHFHRRVDEEWRGEDGKEFRRICLPDWTGESGAAGFVQADDAGGLTFRDWE